MIELKNITKKYANSDYPILQNVSLRINKGEVFGILGASGAGKSTLLRCINLLEKPSSGEVFVNNTNLTQLAAKALRNERHKIGFVFQHFNLLASRTVFENVALPLEITHTNPDHIQTRVIELLQIVGLAHKKNSLTNELSGGQKQRVAIARALASNAEILLCDEATSALDSQTTQSILQLLKQINEQFNITIVIVSHELDVIKQICDRVCVLDQGQIIEVNSTLNIFARPEHALTQKLVQRALHLSQLQTSKPDTALLKLTFMGDDSNEPVITNLIKRFDVVVNIIHALIERIQNTTVGFTICEISGNKENLKATLEYLNTTSIGVEVLHA